MIYLLPGMGADHRMYPGPWAGLPDCVFADWPGYSGEQSLAEVAARVVQTYRIKPDSWLVGSSLGGMVAGEIAKLVPLRGVILLGSAKSPAEFGAVLRLLAPLADLAPVAFLQQLAGKAPSELTQMFKDSDPAFIRAMCRAILRWEGITDPTLRLHRIHGRHDLVIPPPERADYLLNGGHLIAMTHAEECVSRVREIMAS